MSEKSIIWKIDRNLLVFITKITEPWRNEYDVQMMYAILNSTKEEDTKVEFRSRIGSNRRLNNKTLPYEVFFNEFTVQMKVSANSFELTAMLFHNTKNYFEEFRYVINPEINDGIPEANWIFPQESETSEPEMFFNEILLLLKQNRDIRIYSEVGRKK